MRLRKCANKFDQDTHDLRFFYVNLKTIFAMLSKILNLLEHYLLKNCCWLTSSFCNHHLKIDINCFELVTMTKKKLSHWRHFRIFLIKLKIYWEKEKKNIPFKQIFIDCCLKLKSANYQFRRAAGNKKKKEKKPNDVCVFTRYLLIRNVNKKSWNLEFVWNGKKEWRKITWHHKLATIGLFLYIFFLFRGTWWFLLTSWQQNTLHQ